MCKKRIVLLISLFLITGSAMYQTGNGAMGGRGFGGGGTMILTMFETDDFTGSGNCAPCHSGLTDSTGADVSMDALWRSTMMANAAKDPLWQAKISSEIQRNPDLKSAIEDKCTRCHMPMARVQALADVTPVEVFGPGFLDSAHYLHEAAMDGTSCSACHQITAEKLGLPSSFSGDYTIDTSTISPDRLIYGSFGDPFRNTMQMLVGYTPVQGSHINTSEYCATCHMLYTPTVDQNGNVVGKFPEQTPFLEWQNSVYAPGQADHIECQGCHMPNAPGTVQIANRPIWLAQRYPVGRHEFAGGNTLLLDILKIHSDELGVTADASHLDTTKTLTLNLLQTQTAAIAFTGQSLVGGQLTVDLEITNVSGHKFPTGVPLRRAWIHMIATDRRGRIVFESGRPGTDGSITGNNADIDSADYEPHYNLITAPDQVQIYEPIMIDPQGNVTYTFLSAAEFIKDNRLLPDGFAKNSADPDIAVYGAAYTDLDFTGGSDKITYMFSVNEERRPFTVTAKLLYHPVSYRAMQDLSQDDTLQVNRFMGYYNAIDKTPVQIASTQANIP